MVTPGHRTSLSCESVRNVLTLVRRTLADSPESVRPLEEGPQATGSLCHLDGANLVRACIATLKKEEVSKGRPDPAGFTDALCQIMEVAEYVRYGGVKSMIYRLETGTRSLAYQYLDELSHRLCFRLNEEALEPVERKLPNQSVLERLRAVDADSEKAVTLEIQEIEALLVEISRLIDPLYGQNLKEGANGKDDSGGGK